MTSDPGARWALGRAGFTLWWDAAGKQKKTFGLTIPPVFSPPPRRPGSPERSRDRTLPPPPPLTAIGHVEVRGAGADDRRRLELPYATTLGFGAVATMTEGVLVYEVKVPLTSSDSRPHAIHAAAGHVIGFGLETSDLVRPEEPAGEDRPGERRRPGGMPGGMGGRGGHGGPHGGTEGDRPGAMAPPKPIKVWGAIRLGVRS